MKTSSTKVLVTGANGFIALHAILHLLRHGYVVRGTVRSAKKEAHVRETLAKHADIKNLEFAYADLMKDDGWEEAARGCQYVLHLASPFPANEPKDENELIAPARDGTLRVLRAAHAQAVKRVVFLSSMACIFSGHEGENRVFDETDWAILEKTPYAYSRGKTLAERAAWDFINSIENKNKMELVSLNPPYVFGPVLDNHPFTSSEWIGTPLRGEVPGTARIRLDYVDARDLAEAFVKAMTTPEAAGKRFCCVGVSVWFPEVTSLLNQHFAPRGYKVATRLLPDFLIRFLGMFDRKVKVTAIALGWDYTVSTQQAQKILGWKPRAKEETIIEMAESMIEHRLV